MSTPCGSRISPRLPDAAPVPAPSRSGSGSDSGPTGPGSGSGPGPQSGLGSEVDHLFDVEQFRVLSHRLAVARVVSHPTVVLGSTQRAEIISRERAAAAGVDVVRRRGGGGAVLLRPGDHLWLDAWIPRDDPLWESDVAAAALWCGAWWRDALAQTGVVECVVHQGRAEPGPHGALVCFSGRGPGEVFRAGRKLMGISQWRSREGSLFHSCAYTHWDPAPLVELFDLDPSTRESLVTDLARSAAGMDDLDLTGSPISALAETLASTFRTWSEDRPHPRA
jgi:lipoate-protein ligase A